MLVFLGLYVLGTSKVTPGWVLTYDRIHSSRLYSAAPREDCLDIPLSHIILSKPVDALSWEYQAPG